MAEEAAALMQKADKKVKSWGVFGNKWEEAQDMYHNAAIKFKMVKQWQNAAEAFMKECDCHVKLDSKYEGACCLVEAANSFKKVSPADAVSCLSNAVDMYTEMGKFSAAAKHEKEIGEIYEAEGETEKAMEHFTKAADFFSGEESNSSANACLLKVAHFAATLQQFDKAIELFEKVASEAVTNNLIKYSAKDYLFKAMLCQLAAAPKRDEGVELAKAALQRYLDMDIHFHGTRELTLVEEVIASMESRDVDTFTEAVAEFDSIAKLDNWKTTLLLSIKKSIGTVEVL